MNQTIITGREGSLVRKIYPVIYNLQGHIFEDSGLG